MTATIEAPQMTTSGDRLRFYSPDAGRLVWKSWGQMTPAEQAIVREKYPSFVPDTEKTGDIGRYADLIDYYTIRLTEAQRLVREGRDGVERGHAAGAVVQFRKAIDVLKEAETIPEPADAWFVAGPGELKTRIPPTLGGPYAGDMDPSWVIQTQNHIARLSNPIHIAWMRRLVREGVGDHRWVVERKFNPELDIEDQALYPQIHPSTGELNGWTTRQSFFNGVAGGMFRE